MIMLETNMDILGCQAKIRQYRGFSSLDDCRERLWTYNHSFMYGSLLEKVSLAQFNFAAVIFNHEYYLVATDGADKVIVTGYDCMYCLIDGMWQITDMTGCDVRGYAEDYIACEAPYVIDSFFEATQYNQFIYDTARTYDSHARALRCFSVLEDDDESRIANWEWRTMFKDPCGYYYVALVFSTFVHCFMPLFDTQFQNIFLPVHVKMIENVYLEDKRVCCVDPFQLKVKTACGAEYPKAIFSSREKSKVVTVKEPLTMRPAAKVIHVTFGGGTKKE